VAGDLHVQGAIDPAGLEFTNQPSVPVVADAKGTFWVDNPVAGEFLMFSGSQGAAATRLDSGAAGGGGGGAFSSTQVPTPETAVGLTRLRLWAPGAVAAPDPDFVFPGISLTGAGDRMQFDSALRAFRAGGTTGTAWDSSGSYSMAFGIDNQALAEGSSVLAGADNTSTAAAVSSTIGGGRDNTNTNPYSVVGGGGGSGLGQGNQITGAPLGKHCVVGGGKLNIARGPWSAVGGGLACVFNAADAPSAAVVVGGNANLVNGNSSNVAIGGGLSNTVNEVAGGTLLGGELNVLTAGADGAFIACGRANDAQAPRSVVVAGESSVPTVTAVDTFVAGFTCLPTGASSTCLGTAATAVSDYSLVMTDVNTNAPAFNTAAPSTWNAAFENGFYLYTQALPTPAAPVGVTLGPGDTAWNTVSDRRLKENVRGMAGVLDRIEQLPLYEYNYVGHDRVARGPVAQDWHRLFPSNRDPLRIGTMEVDAVVLAGIRELTARVRNMERAADERADEVGRLTSQLTSQRVGVAAV
jgi:hypothetical protein